MYIAIQKLMSSNFIGIIVFIAFVDKKDFTPSAFDINSSSAFEKLPESICLNIQFSPKMSLLRHLFIRE